ncbi:helix-turn-helix domain-containing protein [Paenibacillus wulumuqiensis]|uniref:helix-turn-helix domain-containing protein n=1 Tax=Paenibacillus wulumuqiensis TaxID=1567107 RepID=UPI0006196886|nr:MerR family transcriptional regulator [Paenibacillus wulumuqiensis]
MNNYLTISELARLMNVSTHQIRYFEEQGVLLPACVADNQYRMYGTDEVYRLSHILLLRKLGVPVRQIRESMDSFSADQYSQLLRDSMEQLDQQISQLTQLKQLTANVLGEYEEHYASGSSPYRIHSCPPRQLHLWTELQYGEALTARRMLQLNPYPEDLFETDLYYIQQEDQLLLCYMDQQALAGHVHFPVQAVSTHTVHGKAGDQQADYTAAPSISLAGGSYLCAHIQITEEEELHRHIQQFEQHMQQQNLLPAGPLILIEKSYLSLFNNATLHYELQMPLTADRASLEDHPS